MNIPFVDLKTQYRSIENEIHEALFRVLDNTAYILGDEVSAFEREFAVMCEAEFGVGVSSGTAALHLALLACGVSPGDEVITVPNTFIATVEAVSMVGATPVFVDIDEVSYHMNVRKVEEAITSRTKAIIPVHLFGQPVDMDPLLRIAKDHQLKVIEDACQAHGAEYRGKRAGSFGDAACFSFYPSKNLGTLGEAGMVVTSNEETAEKVRQLRDHGQTYKNRHQFSGFNYRMEGIHGAVLRVKLRRLAEWNEMRRRNARLYSELLSDCDVALPSEREGSKHVYHLYIVRAHERDGLSRYLESRNIGVGIHYPVPIHLQEAYRSLGYQEGDFPVAEKAASEILSLPMYPELSKEQIERVVFAVKEFLL